MAMRKSTSATDASGVAGVRALRRARSASARSLTGGEIATAFGAPSSALPLVSSLADVYRNHFFERPHELFFGSDGEGVLVVCCVQKVAHFGWHEALYVSASGLVKGRVVECSVEGLNLKDPSIVWRKRTHDLNLLLLQSQLLGMEARLGPKRFLTVGIVFVRLGQEAEEDMLENEMGVFHREFLEAVGEPMDPAMCKHYGKDIAAQDSYCASFCGHEIFFHVAPFLAADDRHKLIGSDKVVIYCCSPGCAFVPRFRCSINAIGIVCLRQDTGWTISVFYRNSIVGFCPTFPSRELSLQELRKAVLALAINGNHAVMGSSPYSLVMAKAMQFELDQLELLDRVAVANAPKRKGFARALSEDEPPALFKLQSRPSADNHPVVSRRKSEVLLRRRASTEVTPVDEVLDCRSEFGKPLSDDGIPRVVRMCIEYFRQSPSRLSQEGLFRIPGSSNAIMQIRNMFLEDNARVIDLNDCDPHAVASALKAFLFELPDSLIPSSLWEFATSVTDARDFEVKDAIELLQRMPKRSVCVLEFVCAFAEDVVALSEANKMTFTSLGVVFGPVLFRPVDDSAVNLRSPMPKKVVSLLFLQRRQIF